MSTLIRVIQVTEATKRIPSDVAVKLTYFSAEDVWLFDATLDRKVCNRCRHYEEVGQWRGNNLRLEFPNLVILDVNTIGGPEAGGKGLVHPNCRCRLKRELVQHEPITPRGT